MIILDTNVISEFLKPVPAESVIKWFDSYSRSDFYISTITVAEIFYGINILADSKRKDCLSTAVSKLFDIDFAEKILSFDQRSATEFAKIAATRKQLGRPISAPDCILASITKVHEAALATRNVADFDECGITVINPWID